MQRAFRWRSLHKAVFDEIMRRAKRLRQQKKQMLEELQKEQSEIF